MYLACIRVTVPNLLRAVLWSLSSRFQQLDKKKKKLSGAIVVSASLFCSLEQVLKSIRTD
jgi:hypothetical protein